MMDIHSDSRAIKIRCGDGNVYLDLLSDDYSCAYEPRMAHEEGVGNGSGSGRHLLPYLYDPYTQKLDLISGDLSQNVPINLLDVAVFSAALAASFCLFPGRTVRQLVMQVEAMWERNPSSEFASVSSHDISRKFEKMVSFLPFRPSCLFKSYFHLRYLSMTGLRADWIFGVQLFPFHAHCWIEDRNCILGDRADYISFYSPLMKVSRPAP